MEDSGLSNMKERIMSNSASEKYDTLTKTELVDEICSRQGEDNRQAIWRSQTVSQIRKALYALDSRPLNRKNNPDGTEPEPDDDWMCKAEGCRLPTVGVGWVEGSRFCNEHTNRVSSYGADNATDEPEPVPMSPIAQGLFDEMEPHFPAPSLDDAEIAKRVDKVVKWRVKQAAVSVTVIQLDGEKRDIGKQHKLFKQLHLYATTRKSGNKLAFHPYLYGAPGAGKTQAVQNLADALGCRYAYVSLTLQSSMTEVKGTKNPFNGKVLPTAAVECIRDGGLLFLDEYDNAHPTIQVGINSLLSQGYMAYHGDVLTMHEDCVIIAAGNTGMRGGSRGHMTRPAADSSTRDRFTYLEWCHDEKLERAIVLNENPNAEPWLEWLQSVRKEAAKKHPDLQVGMRTAIDGAVLLATGLVSTEQVAHSTLWKDISHEVVQQVTSTNPYPVADMKVAA